MIPKKIYQTYKDYNLSIEQSKLIKHTIDSNPEFEYFFMDDDECLEFIESNFDHDFIQMYKSLPLGVMRSDVWRVAVIYINGGVYSDIDVKFQQSIYNLISDDDLVVFNEEFGGISNFFFSAKPKHPTLGLILQRFVKDQDITRNCSSGLLVQNFGMNIFHQIILQEGNYKLLSFEESKNWVHHLFHGTWRESEENYKKNSLSTKPITFVTTFHENGYNLYGQSWVDSFIKHVATKRSNIKSIIYTERVSSLKIQHPQIKLLEFEEYIPNHKVWKKNYLKNSKHHVFVKNMTTRFSHKGFVIMDALTSNTEGYLIWLDGDVIFKDSDYSKFPEMFFKNGETIACQIEDGNHVESGILIFDLGNPDLIKFVNSYKKNYELDEILHNYNEPYDGHVTRRSIDHSQVKVYDLNNSFGRGGIQSDPNETFLHPEINSRFTHNIGITGKRNYNNWDDVKTKDNIFTILEGRNLTPLSKNQLKIRSLRNKR
jgi:hypothetical protein